MIKSARIFGILVACISVTLIFTSCSKPEKNEMPTVPTQDPVAKEMLDNPALSRSGALVVVANSVDGTYNPLENTHEAELWVSELVFESLLSYDQKGNIFERLASSYTVSEDGLSINISLKEGVVFHDGTSLTSKDVIFTYEKARTSELWLPEFEHFLGVEAVDDYNLIFRFDRRRYGMLNLMTLPILSYEAYGNIDDWKDFIKPVGTGMFKFEAITPGENIVLTKNLSYWDTMANISGIVIRQMDYADAFEAFAEGKIDLFELPASKATVNDIKSLGFGNVMIQNSTLYTYIGLNMNSTIMNIPEVRKALIYSLNREQFIQDQWNGYAETIDFLTTGIGEFEKGILGIKKYPFDIEIAKQLLDDAGIIDSDGDGIREYDGESVSISWNAFADVDWSYNLTEKAAQGWRSIGLDVKVIYNDYDSVIGALNGDSTYDMWNMAWQSSGIKNPEIMFGPRESVGKYNFGNYNDIVANQIFSALHVAQTTFEIDELLTQWHIFQTDALPGIPVARLKSLWAYNSRVKNLSIDIFGTWTGKMNLMEIQVLQ